jgi:hypothetical protein
VARAASIFHYKEYPVEDVERYLKGDGVHVRLNILKMLKVNYTKSRYLDVKFHGVRSSLR